MLSIIGKVITAKILDMLITKKFIRRMGGIIAKPICKSVNVIYYRSKNILEDIVEDYFRPIHNLQINSNL